MILSEASAGVVIWITFLTEAAIGFCKAAGSQQVYLESVLGFLSCLLIHFYVIRILAYFLR